MPLRRARWRCVEDCHVQACRAAQRCRAAVDALRFAARQQRIQCRVLRARYDERRGGVVERALTYALAIRRRGVISGAEEQDAVRRRQREMREALRVLCCGRQ